MKNSYNSSLIGSLKDGSLFYENPYYKSLTKKATKLEDFLIEEYDSMRKSKDVVDFTKITAFSQIGAIGTVALSQTFAPDLINYFDLSEGKEFFLNEGVIYGTYLGASQGAFLLGNIYVNSKEKNPFKLLFKKSFGVIKSPYDNLKDKAKRKKAIGRVKKPINTIRAIKRKNQRFTSFTLNNGLFNLSTPVYVSFNASLQYGADLSPESLSLIAGVPTLAFSLIYMPLVINNVEKAKKYKKTISDYGRVILDGACDVIQPSILPCSSNFSNAMDYLKVHNYFVSEISKGLKDVSYGVLYGIEPTSSLFFNPNLNGFSYLKNSLSKSKN